MGNVLIATVMLSRVGIVVCITDARLFSSVIDFTTKLHSVKLEHGVLVGEQQVIFVTLFVIMNAI